MGTASVSGIPASTRGHTDAIQSLLDELHQRYAPLSEGAPADYIPELAKADPADFGIVIATVDGRLYAVGDATKPFTIQSISKPFAYGLALSQLGAERMAAKVGVEPSGEAFNAISLDPSSGRPRNPMINAGAIATTSQLVAHQPQEAEQTLLSFFAELAGRPLAVDEAVYRSERETGHRNRAIGHLLRNVEIIESDPEAGLDLYFRQCSIQVTCRDLAVMAATLACQGRNPLSGRQPLSPDVTTRVLALMASCGTYDFAGQWLHDVGMPAKSGVGGGILAVVPGRLGIAVYSPPLDALGNSVRGIAVCNDLSERLGLSLFQQVPQGASTVRRSYDGSMRQSRRWRSARDRQALRESANAIHIVDAQGILEFAAVERLVAELRTSVVGSRVLILDLARVLELPPQCGALLARQRVGFREQGLALLLSNSAHLNLQPLLAAMGGSVESILCQDLDQAIERAEDLYLNDRYGRAVELPIPLDDSAALGFLGLVEPECRRQIVACMEPRSFAAGEQVIGSGEAGDELFLVLSGRFTTSTELQDGLHRTLQSRLATFGPGICFGEIAFLSGQVRSARIQADVDSRCLVLTRLAFDQLGQDDPRAVAALLLALGCELGQKLAFTTQQLIQMQHL
ncbi:MAG: glutaminase A [Cyanobacteriota bacterium]